MPEETLIHVLREMGTYNFLGAYTSFEYAVEERDRLAALPESHREHLSTFHTFIEAYPVSR